jgi:hypothetical protein
VFTLLSLMASFAREENLVQILLEDDELEKDTKLGDDSKDCIGFAGVPLELKMLGSLQMPAKGCS